MMKLQKITVPDTPDKYYFVKFNSGEHETGTITDRHDIDIEVLVEGNTPLGDVERIGRERAERFLRELAGRLT